MKKKELIKRINQATEKINSCPNWIRLNNIFCGGPTSESRLQSKQENGKKYETKI